MRLREKLGQFLHQEEGQSTFEYVLILFAVVLLALKFKEEIVGKLNDSIGKVGGKMDQVFEE